MDQDEKPKRALITGGEGNLASALAQELTGSGWSTLSPGRRELDVSDAGSVDRYFGSVSVPFDLLILNAGVSRDSPVLKMGVDDWDEVLGTNLTGAFRCARAAARGMIKQRSGHIVAIGSFSALAPPAGQANYAAAKAGLIGFTQSLARELGPRNVRANCVLPGFLETKFTSSVTQRRRDTVLGEHVLGRFSSPRDAARFIVFLDSMEQTSGQVFQLDSRIRRW